MTRPQGAEPRRQAIARAAARATVLAATLAAGCATRGAASPAMERRDALKDEITRLSTQIRDARVVHLRMAAEPPGAYLPDVRSRSVPSLRATCQAERQSDTCDDTCNLADDICDNAERICHIADEDFGGQDTWANEKCQSAKASCKQAKEQCCECQAKAGPAAAPAPPR